MRARYRSTRHARVMRCHRLVRLEVDMTAVSRGSVHGASWGPSMVAVDTGALNHPWNIVADGTAAHVLTGPDGAMQYAHRFLGP